MTGSFRDYGKIDPYVQFQYETKRKERRRILIIVGASVFLAVAVICVAVGVVVHNKKNSSSSDSSSGDSPQFTSGSSAIQAACNTTRYPDTCSQEFNDRPDALTANPLQLVTIGVTVALEKVTDAYTLSLDLANQAGLDPREKMALEDCSELLGNTIDYLNTSVQELTSLDIQSLQKSFEKIEVLLSTASGEQTACMDGFYNINGSAASSMLVNQDNVDKILINAVCLVETLSSLGSDLTSWKNALPSVPKIHLRRLLSLGSDTALDHWASAMGRELAEAPASSEVPDAIVASDGTGNFKTLKEALADVPEYSGRYVIYIKAGTYDEGPLNVSKSWKNLTLLGDGCGNTIITGQANVAQAHYTTYRSATVGVLANGFLARNITFRNTAGPDGEQAVAMRANSKEAVFDNCCFEGYQDTLYALSGQQFYRGCTISGTVDFMFGNAIAVFQDCDLVARLPAEGQQNTYTAQGRKDSSLVSGFSFQNCNLIKSDDLENATFQVLTYLGRPWKAYSTSVFMQSYYDSHVNPAGWLSWNASNPFESTCYYAEYLNTGPGSGVSERVDWKGVHPAITEAEASEYTVNSLFPDTSFIPTDVPFQTSL